MSFVETARIVFAPEVVGVVFFVFILLFLGSLLYFHTFDTCLERYTTNQSLPEEVLKEYEAICHERAMNVFRGRD